MSVLSRGRGSSAEESMDPDVLAAGASGPSDSAGADPDVASAQDAASVQSDG